MPGFFDAPPWHGQLLVGVFLIALCVVAMWPFAPPSTWATEILDNDDPYLATVQWWVQRAIATEPSHLVRAPFFFPSEEALTASDHIVALAVPTAPLGWAGLPALLVYRITTLLIMVLGGLGGWLLVARLTGDRWAGLLAAVVYAFNPISLHSLARAHVMAYWTWPFLALLLEAHRRNPGQKKVLAGVLALLLASVLIGWYATLATLLFMACWILSVALIERRRLCWRWLGELSLLGVLTGLVLIPFVWVYSRNASAVYFYSDLAEMTQILPWQYAVPSSTVWLAGPWRSVGLPDVGIREGYLGVTVWLVLLVGVAAWMHRSKTFSRKAVAGKPFLLFLFLGFLGGIAFSAGPFVVIREQWIPLPFTLLGRLVEPLRFARWPYRYGLFVVFAVAIGGSLALVCLRNSWGSRLGRRTWAGIAMGISILAFLDMRPTSAPPTSPVQFSPLLNRMALREDLTALSEVPVTTYNESVRALLRATVHRVPVHQGYTDVGLGGGQYDLWEFLNMYPGPEARAAMEYLGLDALLLVRSRFASPDAAAERHAGWNILDEDEAFVLVAPDGEASEDVRALLRLLDESPVPPPPPQVAMGDRIASGSWKENLFLEGDSFRTGIDSKLAVGFSPPLDPTIYRRVTLTFQLDSGPSNLEETTLFWRGIGHAGESGLRAVTAPVPVTGEPVEIVFDLSRDPRWVWSPPISTLRWDITRNSGYRGRIISIRVE